MKYIGKFLNRYKGIIALEMIIKTIGTLMVLFLPMILSYILDDIIPTKKIDMIVYYGLLMALCAVLGLICNIVANRMSAKITRNIVNDMRHELFEKIISLSSSQIDRITIPSLISRMTTDTYNIHQAIGSLQRIGIRAPILLIGGLAFAYVINVPMSIVMSCCLPVVVVVVIIVYKLGLPLFAKVQKSIDKLILIVRENISGIRVVKALNKEEYESNRFKNANIETTELSLKANKKMALINPILNVIMNFGLVFVIYMGAVQVNQDVIESGSIIAFMTYFTLILNALLSITKTFIQVTKAIASSNRIKEVMDYEEDLKTYEDLSKSNHFIEFRDVNFSYNGIKNNLSDISFSIEKNESLGIIGATGSGKTTIISLLLRLYDPSSGSIFVGGKNIKSIDKKDLRAKFGVAFQNDMIFGETIYENISFGRGINLDDVKSAVDIGQAREFVENYGYDKDLVSKGNNLSGGQKQRILLSRAMAGKPEIIILDDSFSALDLKTEKEMRKAISTNLGSSTMIVIASRISSIKDFKKIIVIEEGKIIGIGTHKELLESCPIYKEIKISQMGE